MDLQKLKKKKERAKAEGNLDNEYFVCKQLAEVYFTSEKYDLALDEYKQMERISERLNNMVDVGRANRMIGEVYCEKGEFDKAIIHQMKHLVLSREAENRVEEQRALATLGRTYFLKAESFPDTNSLQRVEALQQAKVFYKDSLAVCNSLSDSDVGQRQKMEMISRLFLNIGLVLDCQNQYESAIDYMQKATSICKKLDLWEDLYRTYLALGGAYHRHRDFNQSIKTYDLAVNVAERLSNKQTLISDVLLLKADVLLDLPDMRGARQALVRAYKLKPSSSILQAELEKKLRLVAAMCEYEEKLTDMTDDNDSERKKLYEEMGDAASELNNFKLALIYYHLMLECVEKCGKEKKALIDSYVSLAQTYKDDQQYSKSLEYFRKELELEEADSPEACKTLLNIAEVYQLMGLKDEMLKAYNEAKDVAMKSSDIKLKKTVLRSIHTTLVDEMRYSEAEVVQRELNALSAGFIDDSTDEEEDTPPRNFGLHIDLDQLTDEECIEGLREMEDKKRHDGRTRSKRTRNANIERRNEKGETPLHVAAIQGNINHVLKLIDQGHRVDVKDNSGWTPLHEACNHGHIEVVRALLELGAPVNDRGGPHCDGVTPLLDAASNGNLDVILVLLDHGASPLMRTNSGESVIDCLSGWRKRRYNEVGVDLSGETLAQYKTIYKKLAQMLEKVGQRFSGSDDSLLERETSFVNFSPPRANASRASSSQTLKSSDKKCSDKRRNAACDYENAIRSLRFRSNTIDPPNGPERSGKVKDGLILEEENVDDWLEDDMPANRPTKKQKLSSTHEFSSTSRIISPPYLHKKEWCEDSEEPNLEMEETSSRTSNSSLPKESTGTKQHSSPGNDSFQITIEEKKVNSVEVPAVLPTSHISAYSCVRVRIEEKVVIVPVPSQDYSTRTIAWLAAEAALRYKSLEGMEPVLQLEMDGGLLVGSDPLSIISPSPTTLILGRVQSWRHTSLVKLYQEACQALKQSVNDEVLHCTEECERTGRLSVSDTHMSWLALEPLLKAVARYRSLTVLSLASAALPSTSIIEVSECLSKLGHIKELDLNNTNITDKELETIGKVVNKNKGFQRLEVLNVSYNPVKEWRNGLENLIECCPCLRYLSIAAHNVSSSRISFSKPIPIERLDASYNELNSDGTAALLEAIDWTKLKRLELAGCGCDVLPLIARLLHQYSPPNLTSLDLSYTSYAPNDLTLLTKGTENCKSLTRILLDSEDEYGIEDLTARVNGLTLPSSSHRSAPYSFRVSVK